MVEKFKDTDHVTRNKDTLQTGINDLIKKFISENKITGLDLRLDLVRSHPLEYEAIVRAFV